MSLDMLSRAGRRLARAVLLALSIGAAGRAEADSISYTTELNSRYQPGSVPLFDPALGTLLALDFSASGGGGELVAYFPAGVVSGTCLMSTDIQYLRMEPPGEGFTIHSTSGPFPFSSNPGPSPSEADLEGTFAVSTSMTSGLSAYEGTGTAQIQISTSFTITSPMLSYEVLESGSSGTATVTYVYRGAVPEPSSPVMAVIGLASAMVAGRRHRRVESPLTTGHPGPDPSDLRGVMATIDRRSSRLPTTLDHVQGRLARPRRVVRTG